MLTVKKTLPKIICIDKFYTSKISSSKYACIILNFITKQIVEVYSSRHIHLLANRFTSIPETERNNVTAVIINM